MLRKALLEPCEGESNMRPAVPAVVAKATSTDHDAIKTLEQWKIELQKLYELQPRAVYMQQRNHLVDFDDRIRGRRKDVKEGRPLDICHKNAASLIPADESACAHLDARHARLIMFALNDLD